MERYTEGCLVCGAEIVYSDQPERRECFYCGQAGDTNAACQAGHYVCDTCHAEPGFAFISQQALAYQNTDPVDLATQIMRDKTINMHGPEHHFIVVSALLASYRNAGGEIDLPSALHVAFSRASSVPGGACGFWGSCGAGVSTGIFISVVTGATPLSEQEWSLANLMTSQSLNTICQHGGPRCCKRNTWLAITQAIDYVEEHLNLSMIHSEKTICEFSSRNQQCRKARCLFHPEHLEA